MRPSVASLFCGAGGLDLGFKRAGFGITYAVDADPLACKTYASNMGITPDCRDIADVNRQRRLPECDVVIGGPPCQGVSNYRGRSRLDPSAGAAFKEFFKFVGGAHPACFVMENVRGLATMYGGTYLSLCLSMALKAGYNVAYFALNSADFGVAQSRTRIFIVGFQKNLDVRFTVPAPTHGPMASRRYFTIRDALDGLGEPGSGDVCGEGFSPVFWTRNRRREWWELSWVIPAWCRSVPLHPDSPPLEKAGPCLWRPTKPLSYYRRFSWRECAALQGFPRGWEAAGGLKAKYRQVGNAVPPPLAEAVALSVKRALSSSSTGPGDGCLVVGTAFNSKLLGKAGNARLVRK